MESSSPLPYDLTRNDAWSYSFETRDGIVYHAYFLDFSKYHPSFLDVYTFNIEPEQAMPHPIDNRIAATIVHILELFFQERQRAMLMVCDNLDGKEEKRKSLFARWFIRHNDGNLRMYEASVFTEDYTLYVSIYLHKANPRLRELVAAFYDLVKNNFYPVD